MPKARKKKTPITASPTSSSSNPHSSRTLIRKFHVLLKKQAQLQNLSRSSAEHANALAEVEQEIEALGGLSAYQRMSSIGQGNDRGGGSEKVLLEWLKELGMVDRKGKDKLKLLEVGALKPDNFSPCSSWIHCTPMDLRSRHPAIIEQDFLLMDQDENQGKWDIISLSLVLNFVPEPKDRGRMLSFAHNILRPKGLLFLALPLPCVLNSRYLTFEHLNAIMTAIGFVELKEQWKTGGKMSYWLYQKAASDLEGSVVAPSLQKKTVLRTGNRNNFSIIL